MKKGLLFVLVLMLALVVVACGKRETNEEIAIRLNLPQAPTERVGWFDTNKNGVDDRKDRQIGFALPNDEQARRVYTQQAALWLKFKGASWNYEKKFMPVLEELRAIAACQARGFITVPDSLSDFELDIRDGSHGIFTLNTNFLHQIDLPQLYPMFSDDDLKSYVKGDGYKKQDFSRSNKTVVIVAHSVLATFKAKAFALAEVSKLVEESLGSLNDVSILGYDYPHPDIIKETFNVLNMQWRDKKSQRQAFGWIRGTLPLPEIVEEEVQEKIIKSWAYALRDQFDTEELQEMIKVIIDDGKRVIVIGYDQGGVYSDTACHQIRKHFAEYATYVSSITVGTAVYPYGKNEKTSFLTDEERLKAEDLFSIVAEEDKITNAIPKKSPFIQEANVSLDGGREGSLNHSFTEDYLASKAGREKITESLAFALKVTKYPEAKY
ncbi:MAG: hypothetical protein GY793_03420 [Proteobacteria bacterium]|nr:hypothetical protein [Pseudomonadota bacterium]